MRYEKLSDLQKDLKRSKFQKFKIFKSDIDYYGTRGASGINFRSKNYDSIENLKKNSLDFYASVKSLYLQDRQQKILNSKKIINTQDDSDWEEIQN